MGQINGWGSFRLFCLFNFVFALVHVGFNPNSAQAECTLACKAIESGIKAECNSFITNGIYTDSWVICEAFKAGHQQSTYCQLDLSKDTSLKENIPQNRKYHYEVICSGYKRSQKFQQNLNPQTPTEAIQSCIMNENAPASESTIILSALPILKAACDGYRQYKKHSTAPKSSDAPCINSDPQLLSSSQRATLETATQLLNSTGSSVSAEKPTSNSSSPHHLRARERSNAIVNPSNYTTVNKFCEKSSSIEDGFKALTEKQGRKNTDTILKSIFGTEKECPQSEKPNVCQPSGAGGHADALMTINSSDGKIRCAKKIDDTDLYALRLPCLSEYDRLFSSVSPQYYDICYDSDAKSHRVVMDLAYSLKSPMGLDIKLGEKSFSYKILSTKYSGLMLESENVRKKVVDQQSTSPEIGYRVEGRTGFEQKVDKSDLKKQSQHWVRDFYQGNEALQICLVEKLTTLSQQLKENETTFKHFGLIGASLLIYKEKSGSQCEVKLVDLSNSIYASGPHEDLKLTAKKYSASFKQGLDNLIRDIEGSVSPVKKERSLTPSSSSSSSRDPSPASSRKGSSSETEDDPAMMPPPPTRQAPRRNPAVPSTLPGPAPNPKRPLPPLPPKPDLKTEETTHPSG